MSWRSILALMALSTGLVALTTSCVAPPSPSGYYHSRGPTIHSDAFPPRRYERTRVYYGRPYGGY